MAIDIFSILQSAFNAFVNSSFFHFVKILAGFIIIILLIADILLLSKRLQGDWKVAFYGSKVPDLKKSKYTGKWETIKRNLVEGNITGAKIAMIEADQMFGETLEKIGFKGKDTGERIAVIKPGQLIGLEEAKLAHEVFKKIVHDSRYEINLSEIQAALAGYEKVFRGLELLD